MEKELADMALKELTTQSQATGISQHKIILLKRKELLKTLLSGVTIIMNSAISVRLRLRDGPVFLTLLGITRVGGLYGTSVTVIRVLMIMNLPTQVSTVQRFSLPSFGKG